MNVVVAVLKMSPIQCSGAFEVMGVCKDIHARSSLVALPFHYDTRILYAIFHLPSIEFNCAISIKTLLS